MSLQSDLHLTGPGFGGVPHTALDLFRRAATGVPAYRRHLRTHGIDPRRVLTSADFAAIPPVSKDDYLRPNPVADLMWGGDITRASVWSTSSGSSGRPTYWPRSGRAVSESVELHDRIFRTVFRSDRRTTLLVIGFAMGNWIGGTYTYGAALALPERGHRLSVIAPGIDVGTILENIAALGPRYQQVVLAGYPPFLKDVLDAAGPDVLGQDLRLLMAGENISESWRDHVLDRLGRPGEPERTCLIYGTADMGMIGHETAATVAIRRAAAADDTLAHALFGRLSSLPTLVEYDPAFRFAEVDDDGRLLYTSDGEVPLIRYRINDEGEVFSAEEMEEILRRHGYPLSVRPTVPGAGYIALRSRSDIAASLYAVNIYPDDVRPAFEADLARLTGKFTLDVPVTAEFDQVLVLHAEAARGVRVTDALREELRSRAIAALERTNTEYRALHAVKGATVEPVVVLHEFGASQFAYDIKLRRAKSS